MSLQLALTTEIVDSFHRLNSIQSWVHLKTLWFPAVWKYINAHKKRKSLETLTGSQHLHEPHLLSSIIILGKTFTFYHLHYKFHYRLHNLIILCLFYFYLQWLDFSFPRRWSCLYKMVKRSLTPQRPSRHLGSAVFRNIYVIRLPGPCVCHPHSIFHHAHLSVQL